MSTLYIRLPAKSATDTAPHPLARACPYAMVSHGRTIARQGALPLPELSDSIAQAGRVVLLLAASDVTLLRVNIPPLSAAKLKTALPNLVEDQLIADPADCVVVAGGVSGGLSGGLRTVAVAQRAWLEFLAKTLAAYGARQISLLPAQLCLPCQPGGVTASINEYDADIDVTLRLSEQDGMGMSIAAGQDETSAHAAIRALCLIAPETAITLYVPKAAVHVYQETASHAAPDRHLDISADHWPLWITGADSTTLDLMAGVNMAASRKLNWRAWRWPLVLATVVAVINIAALNIEWWRMKSEAATLRATMVRIYKAAYPKESVVIDPVAQMQQKIAIAKRDAGLPAPDDFIAITATFGEAWGEVTQNSAGNPPAIASLEYRDRSLLVRLKPAQGRAAAGSAGDPTQQLKSALAERKLSLDAAPSESGAAMWKIRSAQ